MTPFEYATDVVLPTIKEFLATRDDRRLAYLASIATYHLVDYLAVSTGAPQDTKAVCQVMRSACEAEFDIVQGVCNGTKHAAPSRPPYSYTPGSECHVPQFALDTPGQGFDEARWDHPGLAVPSANGKLFFLDDCVQMVLLKFQSKYPNEFQGLDLSFFDRVILTASRKPGS